MNNKNKIKVIFDGFETIEQARTFAEWYSGSGEQDSCIWLEENCDLKAANVNTITIEEESVIIDLKLYLA